MAKTKSYKEANERPTKSAKIDITNLENIKPAYSNHVQVSHTPHEFVMSFCFLDHAKIADGENPKIEAECFSRIIITPSFLPSLINALKINQEKYNERLKKEIKRAEIIMEKKNA